MPEHEHDYLIVPIHSFRLSKDSVVCLCSTCGASYRLAELDDGSWVWKPVPVVQEQEKASMPDA